VQSSSSVIECKAIDALAGDRRQGVGKGNPVGVGVTPGVGVKIGIGVGLPPRPPPSLSSFSLPASKRFVVPLTGEASGSPSVLAASYADKIFRSTAQLWFEITVRHEHR
jgi:hypothetical protein